MTLALDGVSGQRHAPPRFAAEKGLRYTMDKIVENKESDVIS
jgi:hypothetical protein